MLKLEDIRAALRDRKLTAVASATGLHYNTILSVASGSNNNPSYDVIKRLSDYLTK